MAKRKSDSNNNRNAAAPNNAKADKKKSAPAKKSGPKKAAAKAGDAGPSFIQKTKQFFREVRVELKKVTWPSRKETMASTSVVIVLVVLVAVYLGLVDVILSRGLKLLFQ